MAKTRIVIAAAFAALLLAPARAAATLVFVRGEATLHPRVFSARDDGSHARRIAGGLMPRVSPNGRWVAYLHPVGVRFEVRLIRSRGGSARRVLRAGRVDDFRFAPDSKRLAVSTGTALKAFDIRASALTTVVRKPIEGFAWAPDSLSLAWGQATSQSLTAPTDLFVLHLGGSAPARITSDGASLNPLWTSREVVFDHQRLRGSDNTPAYELFGIRPDGSGRHRITHTHVPPLTFGLVPVDASADGRRVLAQFAEQDEAETYAVNAVTGAKHRLGRFFVPGALSRKGRVVLAQTGGPDPGNRHDVVAVPWGGGRKKVLARRATEPDWSR